jgi:hypothetical protein
LIEILFRYLFAYEDLSKKLGTMNALSAYCGGRTSMSGDSRRSLIRVRQQSEEKKPSMPIKQQVTIFIKHLSSKFDLILDS